MHLVPAPCIQARSGTITTVIAVFPFSASWMIVLEGRLAGSALPQTKRADVASPRSSDKCVQLHREAWPIDVHY